MNTTPYPDDPRDDELARMPAFPSMMNFPEILDPGIQAMMERARLQGYGLILYKYPVNVVATQEQFQRLCDYVVDKVMADVPEMLRENVEMPTREILDENVRRYLTEYLGQLQLEKHVGNVTAQMMRYGLFRIVLPACILTTLLFFALMAYLK